MRTIFNAALIAGLATATLAGDNLLTNGSFETPGPGFILLQGWENYGGGVHTDASVEVPALDGTTSVKMFGEFTGVQNDQVLLQTVQGISPGGEYTASVNVWHNSFDAVQAGNLVLLQLNFLNSSGVALESLETVAIDPASTPTDQWNLAEITGIAPPSTDRILIALLHLQLDGAATGASFWDDARLTEGAGCANPADFNGDGMLNFFDVSAFLNAFQQGCN